MAAFTTTLPMAVSAFTTRRAYAAAFVIGLFFISMPISGILALCDEEDQRRQNRMGGAEEQCRPPTGDAAKWYALLNVGQVPMHVSDMVFDEENSGQIATVVRELPDIVPIAWYLLLTAGPGFVLWWRYRRLKV